MMNRREWVLLCASASVLTSTASTALPHHEPRIVMGVSPDFEYHPVTLTPDQVKKLYDDFFRW